MDLEKFSQDLKTLNTASKVVKKSMFERLDVSRYEHISSKMLEFLLNSNEEHNIGNLALISLIEEAKISYEYPIHIKTLELVTEVYANPDKQGKIGFIDLVLHLPECTLIVENKISHILNNPFPIYQDYAKKKYSESSKYSGKNYFIIMGINRPKKLPKNYIFVSHNKFCHNLGAKLLSHFEDKEKSKNYYFIQDYLETIINMSNTQLNEDKEYFFKFVTENYQKLDQVKEHEKYIFDVASRKLYEILDYSEYREKLFNRVKATKNNDNKWQYKGYYIYSSAIKKVFNGSQISLIINVFPSGVFLSISLYDNRRKQLYSQEMIIDKLRDYRLILVSEKMEQLFDWEVIVEKWDYSNFDPEVIANTVDKYVKRIENINFMDD